ncbi:hypothetical protein [uncultured Zobellia sp.]|uniref:hypothetical protein n=1 Tax=uncultured Zobellia sp. TaxID=255433 RepID=UPI0025946B5F|nr:hypothetical protein [uncultured Zobellia sp.]
MKNRITVLLQIFIATLLFTSNLNAQGPIDGFFSKKGKTSISLSYLSGNYDKFYVGGQEVSPVPAHNEIDQTIYSLHATYAVTDNLTAIANLPYIKKEGNGVADPINGTTEQSDFQDLSIFLKWAPFTKNLENGSMTYIVALGGSVPLGYEPSGILSLGSGAPGIDAKVGLQYKNNNGFFAMVMGGYGHRGKADNNFNLGNGSDFDAPDVVNAVLKLGYAGKHFYLDAFLDSQSSLNGVDIMGPGFAGNFPETIVNYSKLGGTVFVPFTKFIGASIGGATIIDGRNIGKNKYYNVGLTLNL